LRFSLSVTLSLSFLPFSFIVRKSMFYSE
jgi:hypothetical protein